MNDSAAKQQVLMARQPIFNQEQKVVAYELLYRSDTSTQQSPFRDSQATSEVILNTYTSISDAGSLKRVPAFINLTYDMVVAGNIPDLPRKQVVLELLEDATVDDAFIAGARKLVEQGYRIALDDFVYGPEYAPLLKLAQIVKIDVLEQPSEALPELINTLKPFHVTLLAEKIETYEKLEECKALGFKLFQGHFLSKPRLVTGKKLSGQQVGLLQLVQALQDPDVSPGALEELIIRDPVLTYKLLRIVNSANFSLVRQVESVTEAIVLLGIPQVRKWATLIAMTASSHKPEELSRYMLIRGRMAEQVAEQQTSPNPARYFMAGMMSGLHALLDIEQSQMLAEVPLGDDIKQAIQLGSGDIGTVLNNVINYEAGNWELLPADFDVEVYQNAYQEALEWTKEAMQSMAETT